MTTNVRQQSGVPAVEAFGNATGTPIVIDSGTGHMYVLIAGAVVKATVLNLPATGWAAPTGVATRTTFATSSVTLSDLAERVKALIDDLTTKGVLSA